MKLSAQLAVIVLVTPSCTLAAQAPPSEPRAASQTADGYTIDPWPTRIEYHPGDEIPHFLKHGTLLNMLASLAQDNRDVAVRQVEQNMGYDPEAADAFLSDLLEVQLSMNQRYNADVLQSICRADEVVTDSSVAKRSSRIADDIELASFQTSLVLTESEMQPDVFRKYEQWLQRQHVVYVAFDHEKIPDSPGNQHVSRFQQCCLATEQKYLNQAIRQ